jgi:hypothetical protein
LDDAQLIRGCLDGCGRAAAGNDSDSHGDPFVLDDVADPVALRGHWSETEQLQRMVSTRCQTDRRSERTHSERWISTVGSRDDGRSQQVVRWIGKDLWHLDLFITVRFLHGLPDQAIHGVHVTILTLTLTAFLCQRGMTFTSVPQCLYLFVPGRSVRAERLYKLYALRLYGPYRFRPPMQERLGHRGFISALHSSVESIVGRLESHLNESVGGEPVSSDERLSIPLEFQSLAVVLTDEIGYPGLCEPDPRLQLGSELPSEFFRL